MTETWAATIFLEAASWLDEPLIAAKFACVLSTTGSVGFQVAAEINRYIENRREATYEARLGSLAPRWKVGVLRNA